MQTLYFYDLETSGFSPKQARIMQFAGVRTDMDLNPVGEPHNLLLKLTDDILPDPDALLVTGITPQQTLSDGLTEAEFLKMFHEEIATPGTIFTGFNSVRFDDEFMRYLQYRNFYDPYEWQWKEDRSRWDMLDVVRMTRALRPEGIEWPVDSEGKPTNRLELLTGVNGISHDGAHDALSDTQALVDLARLIKQKQPKLFDYLLNIRDKKKVAALAHSGQPFVYSSGRYDAEFHKTTAVGTIADYAKNQGVIVFDLRFDPADYAKMSAEQIAKSLSLRWGEDGVRVPIKVMKFNKCPAIAPMSVLDDASAKRIGLQKANVLANFKKLQSLDLGERAIKAFEMLDKKLQTRLVEDESDVDARMYDGFFADGDKHTMQTVRSAGAQEIGNINVEFADDRLNALLPLYKARNYPKTLTDEERQQWETFRQRKLLGGKNDSRAAKFFARLAELDRQTTLSDKQRYILQELQLYAESILPLTED